MHKFNLNKFTLPCMNYIKVRDRSLANHLQLGYSDRMSDLSAIVTTLKENGYRLTSPRQRVLDLLLEAHRPMSAQEVFELAKRDMDLATVYRVINLFLGLGLARKTGFGTGSALYEIVGEEHHHHVICRQCGRMEEIEGCLLESLEKELSRKKRFTIMGHTLEFYGICHDCGQKGT